MSKRWSKLQRELYKMISPDINFQIHCTVYRMKSQYGSADLPRYFITLGDEIIFDYPKQFVNQHYPYITDVSQISDLIREYIDTGKTQVFDKHFGNDHWGLINILKAADRRNGIRRLKRLKRKTDNQAANKIIAQRLEQ